MNDKFPPYWDEFVDEDRIDYFFNNRICDIHDARNPKYDLHDNDPVKRDFYIYSNGSCYGYTTVEVMGKLFNRLGLYGFFE